MRIDPRLIGPGLFLVLIGAIPLAVREGAIAADDLAAAWRLWPFLLVLAGLGLLLRGTGLRELPGIAAAVLGGLIVGSLLSGAIGDLGTLACADAERDTTPFAGASGTFESTGTVRLALDCGDATISVGPGTAWRLSGSSTGGVAPAVSASGVLLSVRSRGDGAGPVGRRWSMRLDVPDATAAYELTLNGGAIRVTAGDGARELTGTVNAGSLVGDLDAATGLESLHVTVNAGSARLRLPDASIRGVLTVNAGDLSLCVPPGTALRLTTKRGGLGGNDYGARGLTESAGVWTTPGWAGAARLIDLETTANAGAFSLDPEDGCR